MKKIILIAILVIFTGILYFSGGLYYGWTGKYERAGSIKGKTIPNEIISKRTANQIILQKPWVLKNLNKFFLVTSMFIQHFQLMLFYGLYQC